MIVKNEAHVIARCLQSAAPLVDFVLIADTGSDDDTKLIAAESCDALGLRCAIVQYKWRDFATNRNLALQSLREMSQVDYALMIDADEILTYARGFNAGVFKSQLRQDLYDIKTELRNITYLRPQLFKLAKLFHFKGVVHEFLDCPEAFTRGVAQGITNHPIQDSARNKNPRKYLEDAAVLDLAFETEADPFLRSRYMFYLAQSYRDGGEPLKAISCYLKRSEMGFWDQERYCSLLYAGRLMKAQGMYGALDLFLRAHAICPKRHEAIKEAAACAAGVNLSWLANSLRTRLKRSTDGLFVEAA